MGQLTTWRHSPDEVTDFLVNEALLHRVREHEAKLEADAEEKQKRDAFKNWKD